MQPKTYTQSQEEELSPEIDSDVEVIQQLIELMRTVNLDDSEAILNATTIDDGKGGRILL